MRLNTIIASIILPVASIGAFAAFSGNNLPSAPAMVQEFMKATETVTGDKAVNCELRLEEKLNGMKKTYHTVTFTKKFIKGTVIVLNGKSVKLPSDTMIPYTYEVVLSYDKNDNVNWYTLFSDMGQVLTSRPVK